MVVCRSSSEARAVPVPGQPGGRVQGIVKTDIEAVDEDQGIACPVPHRLMQGGQEAVTALDGIGVGLKPLRIDLDSSPADLATDG